MTTSHPPLSKLKSFAVAEAAQTRSLSESERGDRDREPCHQHCLYIADKIRISLPQTPLETRH